MNINARFSTSNPPSNLGRHGTISGVIQSEKCNVDTTLLSTNFGKDADYSSCGRSTRLL